MNECLNVVAPFKVRQYEKKHRLPKENYLGQIIASFTLCIFDRRELFVTNAVFDSISKILLSSLIKFDCESHVHLFMPNHCHLLIGGKLATSNLWQCVADFKQRSGYWFSINKLDVKWQKDFYDHILRKDEDIMVQVRYILNNPVRKELVNLWQGYKFKGSTLYDFDEWD